MEDKPDGWRSLLRGYVRGPLGLAFFMAWIYLTFYTKVVYPSSEYGLAAEAPWLYAMALSGLLGVVACALAGRLDCGRLFGRRAFLVAAACACAGGDAIVFVGSCVAAGDFGGAGWLVALGATVAALGFVALTLTWGDVIARGDEAHIEFAVPASFVVSSLIMVIAGALPQAAGLVVAVVLPFLTIAFLLVPAAAAGASAAAGGGEGAVPSVPPAVSESSNRAAFAAPTAAVPAASPSLPRERPQLATSSAICLMLLMLVFRVGYGMTRALAADLSSSSAASMVVSGLVSIAIFAVFVVLALNAARSLDSSLVTRWVLPLLLLSLALIAIGESRLFPLVSMCISAYSAILQAMLWILFAKAAHRHPGSSSFYFGLYLVALGLGMALGLAIGLGLRGLSREELLVCLPFAMFAIVALVMLLDGNARRFGVEGAGVDSARAAVIAPVADEAAASEGIPLDRALRDQARAMASRHKLSPREEEILYYLLCGRNRPYIRDTLYISINTVNTHIRNIFAKLDIHSQQELLDLAREEFPARL